MQKKLSDDFYQIMQIVEAHNQEMPFDLETIRPYLNGNIQVRVVPKDGYITKEEVRIKKVFYIISGQYYVLRTSEHGKVNLMSKKSAPQFIGVDRAVNRYSTDTSSNLAMEPCIILEIQQKYFVDCIKENGLVGFKIIENICEKLISASLRSDRLLFRNAKENLMYYLYHFWDESHKGKTPCKITVKHNFIADDIGISTRTLYRALRELKEEGLVAVKNGGIIVTYEQIEEIRVRIERIK